MSTLPRPHDLPFEKLAGAGALLSKLLTPARVAAIVGRIRSAGKATGQVTGNLGKKVWRGTKAQAEGFYSRAPKYHDHLYGGGEKAMTIPQVLKQYVTKPGEAVKADWRAMGGNLRKGKAPRKLTLNRAMFAGTGAVGAHNVATAKKGDRAEAAGKLLGSSAGWLGSSRLRFLPSLAMWAAGEHAGGAAGRLISGKKPPINVLP